VPAVLAYVCECVCENEYERVRDSDLTERERVRLEQTEGKRQSERFACVCGRECVCVLLSGRVSGNEECCHPKLF